jgi:hypothetical protein
MKVMKVAIRSDEQAIVQKRRHVPPCGYRLLGGPTLTVESSGDLSSAMMPVTAVLGVEF